MKAAISPDNASDKSVTWSVTPETGVATISSTGLLTAVANGTVTVVATAQDGSGVAGELDITISNQMVKEIVEVAAIEDIIVDYGTLIEDIGLPETVEVTLDDNATKTLAVVWDEGTPAYDGEIPGHYVFEGIIAEVGGIDNPGTLKATVNVYVNQPDNPQTT